MSLRASLKPHCLLLGLPSSHGGADCEMESFQCPKPNKPSGSSLENADSFSGPPAALCFTQNHDKTNQFSQM